MKKVSAFSIMVAFIGVFMGAGFVSGQELWQFFGKFGAWGIAGIALATVLNIVFALVIMLLAYDTSIEAFDVLIVRKPLKRVRSVLKGVVLFFLFGIVVIMLAGSASLFHEVTGAPVWLGGLLMALLALFVSLFGAEGMLNNFRFLVPVMAVVALIVSFLAWQNLDHAAIESAQVAGGNALIGHWAVSALLFVAYNLLLAIAILVPLGRMARSRGDIIKGTVWGGVAVGVIAVTFTYVMQLSRPLTLASALPIWNISMQISPVLGRIYALMLFAGMFSVLCGSVFAFVVQVPRVGKLEGVRLKAVFIGLALIGSLVGFRELVSTVYPVCGVIGVGCLLGALEHYIARRKGRA